ncbi:MAG TPA: pseudouridine synthase, partial [Longimicrobium sp.]|nr:pseudouridine synthase [Longimicrobium sp.]
MRLQAFLAHSGISSRRAAEELIAAGQVFVNGKSVTVPGMKIRPGIDEVEVQGRPVEVQPVTWLALHKPKGYVTTRIDPYGRKTVYELIPEKYHGLFHVGRLDRDSEGLLLLTNEGELANRMLHPSFGVTKEYWADVEGKPTAEAMHHLTEGVDADGDLMQAESVRRLHQTGENQHRLSVVMREGKKREVRRMLEALGHPVARLIRRRFGPVALGELKPGKWRILAETELATLRDPSGKRPSRPKRLHSGDEEGAEPAARPPREDGGERRPQRKPKPEERARPAAGAGKSAAPARSTPRPSELRAKAREDAVRGRGDEGKPRRGSQERDERPYHERDARGAPAKRGPVKRVRDDEARPSAAARGPVKRVRDGDARPSVGARVPVKRIRDDDARPSAGARGPVKRVRDGEDRPSTAARGPRERDAERGPSPRDASRGFPKAGRAKAGGPTRPKDGAAPRRTDGDQAMESAYPQTRRGSATPSPRGGAPDERRGAPDRPKRPGGKPVRGGK